MNDTDNTPVPNNGDQDTLVNAQDPNSNAAAPSSTQGDDFVSLSNQAAHHRSKADALVPETAVNDLKSEIEAALSGVDTSVADPDQQVTIPQSEKVVDLDATDQEIASGEPVTVPANLMADLPRTEKQSAPISTPVANDLPVTPKANPELASEPMAEDMSHEDLVSSLKEDIQTDLQQVDVAEETLPSTTGISQTYYSDLSQAMSSNKPETMSELIRKSRFESKEAKILSPRSAKNVAFIGGASFLLLISLGILMFIFGNRTEKVEFITQERVESLVRSNQDTGINVTGLEATRIKQAIRDVIEIDIPQDTINQIYYVEQDQLNNIRRLGIKDIFDKTNNETPTILYDNIENNFTHGVYSTDKNYPFIILKALSYDRALDGLLEWEPTMIDDLATYLDLPPEGTDRSLLKPGFEDDLIKNKNVRVARFLPREVDRRGILDILRGNNEQDQDIIETPEPVDGEGVSAYKNPLSFIVQLIQKPVFAQTTNTPPVTGFSFGSLGSSESNDSTSRVCYNNDFPGETFESTREGEPGFYCINTLTGGDDVDNIDNNGQNINRVCYNDDFPGELFSTDYETLDGYYCIDTASGGEETLDTRVTRTAPVCFDPVTGDRIDDQFDSEGNVIPNVDPAAFCFEAYQCYLYRCFVGDTPIAPIENSAPRPPGYNCRADVEGGTVYHETDSRYDESYDAGVQSCTQFSDITRISSIDNATLCFDNETGQLTQDPGPNVSCVSPLERQELVCIAQNGEVVPPDFPVEKICMAPLAGATTNPIAGEESVWAEQSIDTSQCREFTNNGELQERLVQASFGLRVMGGIASFIGLSNSDVQNMNAIADFLVDVAYGGPTNVPAVNEGIEVVRQLDLILSDIDPYLSLPQSGPNGELNAYGQLLNIIQIIKCSFNIGTDLQWVTSDVIDVNSPIYAGQSSPTVEPLQQTLVQLGLMDSLSISGILDIVTQDSVAQFQEANGLSVSGVFDPETLQWIANILDNHTSIIVTNITAGSDSALIADYFLETEHNLQLSSYNTSVQDLQIILYAEGYQISVINGLFDSETCQAVQAFQLDEGLEVADSTECIVSGETLTALDSISRLKGYVGSGFSLNPQGSLVGNGALDGIFGPGATSFANVAEADSLEEGDIVLLYTFLDEETVLITRDQVVIEEIVKRRALSDIFK